MFAEGSVDGPYATLDGHGSLWSRGGWLIMEARWLENVLGTAPHEAAKAGNRP